MPNSMYLNHLFQQIDGDQTQPPPLQTPVTASHPLPAHLSPTVPPDLHPKPTNDEAEYDENENDDDDDDDDDDTKPQPIVGKKRKQELHRRHSKRYRDNLGELFQNLEQLLPKVVPGCKLKTKSQIIANSVQAVKRLRTEVSALEMQFVLSSPANRTKWVEDTVQAATCFQAVTEPFMRLLVGIQRWKHSELWCRYEVNLLPDGTDSGAPVINPTNTVHDLGPLSSKKFFLKLDRTVSVHDITASTVPEAYRMFSKISHMATFVNGDDSIVGRTASKLSPEWIDLRDPEACHGFKRGEAARQCGFTTCFALPFLVRGHVFASILFYDDQQRFDVGPDINIAQDIASCLGNCYGASAAQSSD